MTSNAYSSTGQTTTEIVNVLLAAHPNTQAIYLYGTWGTEYQRSDNDVDIAVLLPHGAAKAVDFWERYCGNYGGMSNGQ